MKGNIVLTGGHSSTLQQLASTYDQISKTITTKFPTVFKHSNDLHITANIPWSKVLINNVPTGVTNNRGPWTPKECHEALLADNPSYAALNVTQRPSWVKLPTTYGIDTSSSLVVAFEDPGGHLAHSLVDSKHLYILGTSATVKH